MIKARVSITELTFMLFWTLLLVGKGLGMSSSDSVMVLITGVAIIFAILKMVFSKWKRQELIIIVGLSVLGLLVFVKSKDAAVLLTIISICARV